MSRSKRPSEIEAIDLLVYMLWAGVLLMMLYHVSWK